MATRIEYCNLTINPFVGCTKCSIGCENCYAEKLAYRWSKHPNEKVRTKYAGVVDEQGKWTGKVNVDFSCFNKLPKIPKRIFVNSMSDTFHDTIWDEDDNGEQHYHLQRLFDFIAFYPQHTFILLTKRPENAKKWILSHRLNVWLGVTVCNQQEADEKIPVLLDTPAAKRFVSIEPMLGAVDLNRKELLCKTWSRGGLTIGRYLDWVICGGETGPKARPMHPEWAYSLCDQCVDSGVPFFFKSWGEWIPNGSPLAGDLWLNFNGATYPWTFEDQVPIQTNIDSVLMRRVGKKRAGRLLDGREWNEFPE